MKICAIICEFNPFHNGHRYLLERARELSMCNKVLCIMSGNFTQRGTAAVLGKFTRARHAVLGGADCVLELPVPFAVSPAEIFARGAAKIVCSIPEVASIAFGCECGDAAMIERAADILNEESDKFKLFLSEKLKSGESYQRSLSYAFTCCGGDERLLDFPNNVLAIEYVKALKRLSFKGEFIAIKRVGSEHGSQTLTNCYASSTAIRRNIDGDIGGFVPEFVKTDLSRARDLSDTQHEAERLCLLRDNKSELSRVYGVSEGLENCLNELAERPYGEIIKNATGRRYSSSRIERALAANLLKLYRGDCETYFESDLYLKPLAVKGEEILSVLGNAAYPLVIRGRDREKLCANAYRCIESEIFADSVYRFIGGEKQEYFSLIKL